MSNRNNRVVVKSFTQMRKRSRRRREKAVMSLLISGDDLKVLHPAIAALFREEHLASHLVAKTTYGVRL